MATPLKAAATNLYPWLLLPSWDMLKRLERNLTVLR
jgi:hypothetical protein